MPLGASCLTASFSRLLLLVSSLSRHRSLLCAVFVVERAVCLELPVFWVVEHMWRVSGFLGKGWGTARCVPCTLVWTSLFEGGRREVPLYVASCLAHGHEVQGPALVVDNTSTVVVEPNCTGLCRRMQHRVQPCVGLGHTGPRTRHAPADNDFNVRCGSHPVSSERMRCFALQVCSRARSSVTLSSTWPVPRRWLCLWTTWLW